MPSTPLDLYQRYINSGDFHHDPQQDQAVQALQSLYEHLIPSPHRGEEKVRGTKTLIRKMKHSLTHTLSLKGEGFRGIYIYGGVGRGKSMLMDLFYDALPEKLKKRRVHFHAFMIETHDWLHAKRGEKVDNLLPAYADYVAKNTKILCFDEFHVTDVADAMILGRLFTALLNKGMIIVATSNWPPQKLYEGGLQRELFLPFIHLLEERLTIVHLDSPHDYRALNGMEETGYFWPLSSVTHEKMLHLFSRMAGGVQPKGDTIKVKGRNIAVPQAVDGIACFSFAELCERPHSAEDYLAIAGRYHTLFLEGVPKMGYDRRNEAKRFMTLVDVLYDKRRKLIVAADASLDKLYYGHDYAFEFARTVSRLHEMQSAEYLKM